VSPEVDVRVVVAPELAERLAGLSPDGGSVWCLAEVHATDGGSLEATLLPTPGSGDPSRDELAELTRSVRRLEIKLDRRVARIKELNLMLARQRARAELFQARLDAMTVPRAVRRSLTRRVDRLRDRWSA
jgi:uncharacterized coiled-coil protein SlyX